MSFTVVQIHLDRECIIYPAFETSSEHADQILFLNKNDLFEKKVQHSDIRNFFPVRVVHVVSRLPGIH